MADDANPDNCVVGFFRKTGLFTVAIPKEMELGDMRWGAVLRTAQIGIVGLLLYQMWESKGYEEQITATGVTTSSWLDKRGILHYMETAARQPFCRAPYSVDYYYCNRSTATGEYNEFWCEDNIQCARPPYASISPRAFILSPAASLFFTSCATDASSWTRPS